MSTFTHGQKATNEYIAHIKDEVRPYAEKRGDNRQDVLEASLRAVRKNFNKAWPEDND